MDFTNRNEHDDLEEKKPNEHGPINETSNDEANGESQSHKVNPTYLSYQGYHELNSAQMDKETYEQSPKESIEPII